MGPKLSLFHFFEYQKNKSKLKSCMAGQHTTTQRAMQQGQKGQLTKKSILPDLLYPTEQHMGIMFLIYLPGRPL